MIDQTSVELHLSISQEKNTVHRPKKNKNAHVELCIEELLVLSVAAAAAAATVHTVLAMRALLPGSLNSLGMMQRTK